MEILISYLLITALYLIFTANDYNENAHELGFKMDFMDWLTAYMISLLWPIHIVQDLYYFVKDRMKE